jgi:peptidyl-dipeptidase Dcp
MPAIDAAMAEHLVEVETIATNPAAATFDNTVTALEQAGHRLTRIAMMFYGLAGTDTSPALQAIERDLAPKFSAHSMRIAQDERLFARLDVLDRTKATLNLTTEQTEVLDRKVRGFVRAGARLEPASKTRLKQIAERLSMLSTSFGQNVLKDEQDWSMTLTAPADLAGLDAATIATAKAAGETRGKAGDYLVTLSRSLIVPFLEQSTRPDLRETAYAAWIARGRNGGSSDNRATLTEIIALRTEYAALLGYGTYADMSLEHTMAKTPANVYKLLEAVWTPARAAALSERDLLTAHAASEGETKPLAAADWRHYAEKVRKARFNLDESEIKPYLALDNMLAAAFDCASRLFGLTFTSVSGVNLHNPEARAWEVKHTDGRHVGLFIGDFFARPSKRSGAWMSGLQYQHRLTGDVRPIVTNTCNFAKPAPGEPALLNLDDAHTLFHEFGHALHGLLSNVTYPSVSGTSVSRDFVELPSQLYEAWLTTPHVLKNYARHYETNAPMPDDLIKRMKAARAFNMGFSSVEFLASAFIDMELHTRGGNAAKGLDIDKIEAEVCARLGVPSEIAPRHRPTHFTHITGGYAAGYYSYMWSEVLDADAFKAFEEAGDVFDAATAKRLHDYIYSAGGTRDPADLYKAFRGRLPDVTALLEKRKFLNKAA